MKRFVGSALLSMLLLAGATDAAAQPVADLIQKLAQGSDFRVRVQAALEIGKTRGRASRLALEAALDDENAAVRAAAAAALKVMHDPASISALEKHQNDGSAAVRSQIKTTLQTFSSGDSEQDSDKPDVLVQVGKIGSGADASYEVIEQVTRASRERLKELPGVALLADGEKEASPAKKKLPLVMVTGRVKKLEQAREGGSIVYLASIEFVLHKMPGQTIKGVVSGSAKASGSVEEMSDARAMADLRKTAIEAAIASAVRRAPQALRAAAQ
ncbi:MAG TPA: HEAT repeat domain-containing protein [Polyangiaceae bacterium]|nr:HEAT repeat domain-containing protein [Polyangiaceae bacterium]